MGSKPEATNWYIYNRLLVLGMERGNDCTVLYCLKSQAPMAVLLTHQALLS